MKKILLFQHVERENPSYIADYANARGHGLDVIELWKRPTMPDASAYDALIVLGGPMGVYEEYAGKNREIAAITELLGKAPILGICLGSQLVAHAFGAHVYPHKRDDQHIKEVGHYRVALTPEGRQSAIFSGFPDSFEVLQWHGDTFDLPEGAHLLATAELCQNQAFSHGRAYGIQFHVEARPEMVEEWLAADSGWTHTDFDLDEKKMIREAYTLAPTMKEHCYRLLDNFLEA